MRSICDVFVLHKDTVSVIKVPWTQGMFSSHHETRWHAVFWGGFVTVGCLLCVHSASSELKIALRTVICESRCSLGSQRSEVEGPSVSPGVALKGLTSKRPVLQQWHKCSCIIVMLKLNKEQALQLPSDNGSQNVTKLFQEQYAIVHGCRDGFFFFPQRVQFFSHLQCGLSSTGGGYS